MHNIHEFVLASGRTVQLEALHIEPTYAGYDGVPDQKVNDERLVRTSSRMVEAWGQRPTHVIRPESRTVEVKSLFATHGVYLPEITYHAWLISDPIGKWCGSELVVAWFERKIPETGILEAIARAVRDLAWEQLAGGFDY